MKDVGFRVRIESRLNSRELNVTMPVMSEASISTIASLKTGARFHKPAPKRMTTTMDSDNRLEIHCIINMRRQKETKETYNTGDSLVVTDPTTNPALRSLTKGERTGSRVFYELWSYVTVCCVLKYIKILVWKYSCATWLRDACLQTVGAKGPIRHGFDAILEHSH